MLRRLCPLLFCFAASAMLSSCSPSKQANTLYDQRDYEKVVQEYSEVEIAWAAAESVLVHNPHYDGPGRELVRKRMAYDSAVAREQAIYDSTVAVRDAPLLPLRKTYQDACDIVNKIKSLLGERSRMISLGESDAYVTRRIYPQARALEVRANQLWDQVRGRDDQLQKAVTNVRSYTRAFQAWLLSDDDQAWGGHIFYWSDQWPRDQQMLEEHLGLRKGQFDHLWDKPKEVDRSKYWVPRYQ
jgi:hypothetical protein